MNLYEIVKEIINKILKTHHGTYKTILYTYLKKQKLKSSNFSRTYKLVNCILKKNNLFDALIQHLSKLYQEFTEIRDPITFKIFLFERFYGNGLKKRGGALQRLLNTYERDIKNFLQDDIDKQQTSDQNKFFRVLNGAKNFKKVCKIFYETCNILLDQSPLIPYAFTLNTQQLQAVAQSFNIYEASLVISQSTTSCLPPTLLKNFFFDKYGPGQIIDTCSAPGNKTLQLIEYFKPNTVVAFEKNMQRYKLLQTRLKKHNKIICGKYLTFNQNFLEVDPESYEETKYVMIDPSCSGSGMLSAISQFSYSASKSDQASINGLNDIYEALTDKIKAKVASLHKLQVELILHAMKFKNVSVISYSTCSIFVQENEEVVKEVLEKQKKFCVASIPADFWNRRGLKEYEFGDSCIRAHPILDKTDGFFITVFVRVQKLALLKKKLEHCWLVINFD